jgi:CBS domain-containing protein
MKIRDLIAKAPVAVAGATSVRDAAALMESANVGALLVMDGGRLAGIVTDRDIVVRAVAGAYPPDARIDCFMSTTVVTVDADADVHEAYRILGTHGVRRLPVVSGDDIVGMLTVDDLMVGIATDLDRLVQPVVGELIFGHHPSPVPAVRAGAALSSR